MPLNKFTQLSSATTQHSNYRTCKKGILFCLFVATLYDTFKRELAQEEKGYESRSKSLSIPTPLRRAPWIFHASTSENLSFNPNTLLITAEQHPEYSPRQFRSHSLICHCLVFTNSNDKNHVRTNDPHSLHHSLLQGRAEQPSLLQNQMVYHCTSTPNTDYPFLDATAKEEENFPTAPLDDDIWLEDQVPDRPLCIHEQSQSH